MSDLSTPTPEAVRVAEGALRSLSNHEPPGVVLRVRENGGSADVDLPREVVPLLVEILGHIANANGVRVVPLYAEQAAGENRVMLGAEGIELLKRFTRETRDDNKHVFIELSDGGPGAPLIRHNGFHVTYSATDCAVPFDGCTGSPDCPGELKGFRFTATLADVYPYMDPSAPHLREPSRIVRILRAFYVPKPDPKVVFHG